MAAIRLLCFKRTVTWPRAQSRGVNTQRWFVQLDLEVDIFIKIRKKAVLNEMLQGNLIILVLFHGFIFM